MQRRRGRGAGGMMKNGEVDGDINDGDDDHGDNADRSFRKEENGRSVMTVLWVWIEKKINVKNYC
jgi:hypothetical protein